MNEAQYIPASGSFAFRNVRTGEALARFAGDEIRYRHWLIDFISHGPAAVKQIREAISNGSRNTATDLAHALKGRTGMLGLVEPQSITQSLEITLRNSEPSAYWLEELEGTVAEMCQEISAVLGERPS
ncbi:Hpt domain-containing protein [Propionivibrio sp.]|uniref:Hpt domain-containing protein n=1 Tax=Propionivibrio sp. TaxID=2212460 RepID=UPI003BF398F3